MAKVALLVGVSEYEPGLNPLPGAVKDIDAIREVLLHPEMGGFAEAGILLLKNPERQDVEMAIETLFSGRHKDDLVVLYFSGHGIKDDRGRLYLATRTTRKTTQGELIRSTAVSANFIHDRMSESRSKRQVVILDSCFSGAFAEGLSAKDDGTVDIREQLGGEGRVVLTSSSSTQYSFEEQGQDLSIYTRFLIQGIKSGEADRDEDEFISIDELHEYASQKVRELQPAMKPEIYAIREGFKIRLAKVAPGEPSQRYRKEVARFIHRGDISFVGRRTLDVLRSRLGLEATEAEAIEDEVLEPYRKEFREKLQNYEQVFIELLERDETITEGDRHDLQNLQQILGLRNEDTIPIEAQTTARFKSHQENLQAYEQAFGSAVWQEYPLSVANRDRLRQMHQQLKLTAAEVEAIASRITAEVQAYHQKLQEYDRLFANATQQEHPLSEASRANLRKEQQRLGLKDVEVAPIEAKITTQIETYHQKLQQYEQAFVKATQCKHYPDEVTRKQLQQTWQALALSEENVRAIESRINGEIEIHQANLQRYEIEFVEAIQQEYPLSELKRSKLTQRYQALNLAAEDVEVIENPIVEEVEKHQLKLQQYEQVFRESIQFEYPLSDTTREELHRFQQILELRDADVAQVEEQVLMQERAIESKQRISESLSINLPQMQYRKSSVESQDVRNSSSQSARSLHSEVAFSPSKEQVELINSCSFLVPKSKRISFISLFAISMAFIASILNPIIGSVLRAAYYPEYLVEGSFFGTPWGGWGIRMGILSGFLFGTVVGITQWLILAVYLKQEELFQKGLFRWAIATSIGWSLYSASSEALGVHIFLRMGVGANPSLIVFSFFDGFCGGIGALVLLAAQYFVLQRYTKNIWYWFIVCGVIWFFFRFATSYFSSIGAPDFSYSNHAFSFIFGSLLGGAQGASLCFLRRKEH